jgi:uncharacterized membrane protein YdcZ (DUF606 family)
VQQSVFGGLAVAGQMDSSALADSVRSAFVVGMDDASRVAAIIAVAAMVGALILLPGRSPAAVAAGPDAEATPDAVRSTSEV